MSIKSLIGASVGSVVLLASVSAQAQVGVTTAPVTVGVSGTPAAVAGSTVYKAGNVASLVGPAHEVPAALVNSTVPAAQPLTYSVTASAVQMSNGVKGVGANIQNKGLTVHPLGVTFGAPISVQAAKNVVAVAPGAVK